MRIAKIIGSVTLSQSHPSFDGAVLRLAVPLSHENLQHEASEMRGEFEVVWDDLGAGNGSLIAMAEGPEACRPFRPENKPVSAYNAAILDDIDLT